MALRYFRSCARKSAATRRATSPPSAPTETIEGGRRLVDHREVRDARAVGGDADGENEFAARFLELAPQLFRPVRFVLSQRIAERVQGADRFDRSFTINSDKDLGFHRAPLRQGRVDDA